MLRSLLLCVCCLFAPGIDRARTGGPLDELIAKTNALDGFTAHYRLIDRDGVVMKMTLSYVAPDRAVMIAEIDGHSQRVCIVDGVMGVESELASGQSEFARFELTGMAEEDRRIRELLRAEFPGAPADKPAPLGPGVSIIWSWADTESSEKASSFVGPQFDLSRTHVCGWLEKLQRSQEEPSETESELVWVLNADYKVEISKTTGFIVRARRLDPSSKSDVSLEKLELETPSDSALFTIPKSPPEGARDVSADLERSMRMEGLSGLRAMIWSRLAKWIDAKSVTWDEHSPEKLTRVLRPVCAATLECTLEGTLTRTRQWIDSASESLASRVGALARDDEEGLARLAAERDRALADMEQKMKAAMAEFSDRVTCPPSFPKDSDLAGTFLECERAAIRAEYKLQLIDAMLAYFRERTDAALAR